MPEKRPGETSTLLLIGHYQIRADYWKLFPARTIFVQLHRTDTAQATPCSKERAAYD